MIKRYIYNTLGILSFIVPLTIYIYINNGIGLTIIPTLVITYLLYFVSSLFILIGGIMGDIKDPDGLVPFFFFFFFLKNKKIYYSDLGYFYLRSNKRGDEVYVYKQGYFLYEKISEVYYDGNTESLSKSIKYKLDRIYSEELERIRSKKAIKDWDGYLDLPSKRDDKLDQILK